MTVIDSRIVTLDPDLCSLVVSPSATRQAIAYRYGEDILKGFLVSKKSQNVYPIVNGVPRLVPRARRIYARFFARYGRRRARGSAARAAQGLTPQWANCRRQGRNWFKGLGLSQREFLYGTALTGEIVPGSLSLDATCGRGALAATLAAVYGIETVGMDFRRAVGRSYPAKERYAGGYAPFVHFIQGDLQQPPLAPALFDFVYTCGRIHRERRPRQAIQTLIDAARPSGMVYIHVPRHRFQAGNRCSPQEIRQHFINAGIGPVENATLTNKTGTGVAVVGIKEGFVPRGTDGAAVPAVA
ncbi:MAG TPA: methyltransferase domain-containing protein [Gammaproteobacteria bacterium]|nr:methyltransferase domain-containing protein [Gammaproteobacteria bacterium]